MPPFFPVQNNQLIKNREFVKSIGRGKTRFQTLIFFPEKKKPFRYNLTNNHR